MELCQRAILIVVLTALAGALIGAVLGPCVPIAEAAGAQGERSGKQIYLANCAQCHGVDGRGAQRPEVGFDLPLPDLTSCRQFAREPDHDWAAVIHDGGPARAFDRVMPAFGDAMTREQIDAVIAYVRTFCPNPSWPRGELNAPRALLTEKAFPEDEVVLTSAWTAAEGSSAVANKLILEKRIGAGSQFEAVLPFSFQQAGTGTWAGGIGDLVLGAKHVVAHSRRTGSIFSVAGEVLLPTGSRASGFGKGVTILEPFASFGQLFAADGFVQAQVGAEIPVDDTRANKEAFWRLAIGRSFTDGEFGRTWAPMCELVAAREVGGTEGALWDVVPQLHVTLSTRQHIMANVGVRLPLNSRTGRRPQLVMYVLWDWFDGPLFGGW